MKVKSFIREFFLCMFFSILADSIVISITGVDRDSNMLGHFMLLLYSWIINIGILSVGFLLFTLYFFIILYLVKYTEGWKFYSLMTLWAVVFIVTVTINDWNLSPRLWTFSDYLWKGGHYAIYSVVVAAVESVMGWKKKHRRIAAASAKNDA